MQYLFEKAYRDSRRVIFVWRTYKYVLSTKQGTNVYIHRIFKNN